MVATPPVLQRAGGQIGAGGPPSHTIVVCKEYWRDSTPSSNTPVFPWRKEGVNAQGNDWETGGRAYIAGDVKDTKTDKRNVSLQINFNGRKMTGWRHEEGDQVAQIERFAEAVVPRVRDGLAHTRPRPQKKEVEM